MLARLTNPEDYHPDTLDAWANACDADDNGPDDAVGLKRSPPPIMTLAAVRKNLGGATPLVIQALVDHHGMPAPRVTEAVSMGIPVESWVWDTQTWWEWYWRHRSSFKAAITPKTGNVAAVGLPRISYKHISKEWIHAEALKHGRRLSHEMTISFCEPHLAPKDEPVISRLNERERSEVGRLAGKLPTKVWRGFFGVDKAPAGMFLFCVYPECLGRHGGATRWHFHVELFLDEMEAWLVTICMHRIRKRLQKYLSGYASGREVSVEFQPVDQGYAGYCQKNAFDSLDMIESNFLKLAPK